MLQKLQESLLRAAQARPTARISLSVEECKGTFACHVTDRSKELGDQLLAGSIGLNDLEKALGEIVQELDEDTEIFLSRKEEP